MKEKGGHKRKAQTCHRAEIAWNRGMNLFLNPLAWLLLRSGPVLCRIRVEGEAPRHKQACSGTFGPNPQTQQASSRRMPVPSRRMLARC
jgi:hypothetical protein